MIMGYILCYTNVRTSQIHAWLQDQMAQDIRARFKEFNRKRPAGGTDEHESKPKRIQKVQIPQVRASNYSSVYTYM